jgi:DNA primase
MTRDEIKLNNSIKEVALRYGVKVDKKGFCCCVFHNEKTPSMQIKEKTFHCFGCGAHGDIFEFVMKMENCSFKDAYLSLGGEYENTKTDFFAQQRLEKAKLAQEKRVKAEIRRKKQKRELSTMINYYKSVLSKLEPFSDIWCDCQNHIFYLLYAWEEKYIKGNEVDIGGVISRHSKSEFIRNIVR